MMPRKDNTDIGQQRVKNLEKAIKGRNERLNVKRLISPLIDKNTPRVCQ
ncbi:MAG: hypothetical protein V3T88_07945 [Nitrosomonadaceae bacterium]